MEKQKSYHPLISMLVKPKETIRKIITKNPNKMLFLLSFVYGLSMLISFSQSMALGLNLNVFIILLGCLILAPVWGYLVFSFSSILIYFTGKWLKGEGNFNQIRAAIAWSNVPMFGSLSLWIILILVFGNTLFTAFPPEIGLSGAITVFLFLVSLFQLIFSIWILVLYINALAEVQKFSILKAIFNIILAVLIFVVSFYILFMLFSFIFKMGKGA